MNETHEEPLPLLSPRDPDAHKGNFGTALIVGGSRGMTGAAALAGMAALRSGAGRVRVAMPECCRDIVAGLEPSYMTAALPEDEAGRVAGWAYDRIVELTQPATVLALGPGLGRSADLDVMVARLYREITETIVVDADALNALATQPEVLCEPGGPRILTPHPGEFTRLMGQRLKGAAADEAAAELAQRAGAVVVLKGHRTLITDGARRCATPRATPAWPAADRATC